MVMLSECIWIRIRIGGVLLWTMKCGVFDSVSPENLKDVSYVVSSQGCTVQWMFETLPSKLPLQDCHL